MPQVLTTKEYKELEKKFLDSKLKLTLVKTVDYDLQPYGRFVLKWGGDKCKQPNHINVLEVEFNHLETMKTTDDQNKMIVKLMKKGHTDILKNSDGYYYTIIGGGLSKVKHPLLLKYETDDVFREVVNNCKSF